MTSDEKLKRVEAQISLIQHGVIETINCPYCEKENVDTGENAQFCCDRLLRAVAAVLHRQAVDEALETLDRLCESVAKMPKTEENKIWMN